MTPEELQTIRDRMTRIANHLPIQAVLDVATLLDTVACLQARVAEDRRIHRATQMQNEAEITRLQTERRSLWRFVKPEEGAQVVYLGVHAVRWYEAAGEYEPTAGFIQAPDPD